MFEKVELFSKRNNLVEFPNNNWTEKTIIHCTCELNLGFSHKIVWTYGNSIKLTKLIDFYHQLYYSLACQIESSFIYEFPHNDFVYLLEGIKKENNVVFSLKKKYYKKEVVLLEKRHICMHTLGREFYYKIMKDLTSNTNNAVSTKIGELFFRIYGYPHNFEFKIGQKVKTILSENIKTKRIGYIIDRFHHDKEGTNMYLILENNRIITTRYKPNELEAVYC